MLMTLNRCDLNGVEGAFTLHQLRSATRRVIFHQSKRTLRGLRPEQLALIKRETTD